MRGVAAVAAAGALLVPVAAAQAPAPTPPAPAPTPAAPGPGPTAAISMPGKLYAPSDLSVLVGTTVTWRNEDTGNHTVTADNGAFDSGYIGPGGTFARLFDKQGVYKFHCTIHRFMKGVLRVYGLVLNAPSGPVGAGRHVILTGLAPGGSRPVSLERHGTAGGWRVVAVHRARADGGFAFAVPADMPAFYRASAGAVSSPVRAVPVFPRVTARLGDGTITISTTPARPGARVVLQAYDRERFAFFTTVSGRLGRGGTVTLPTGALRGRHVRAVVRGSAGWTDGVSTVVVVR
jgi:plastocyanin